MCFHFFVTHQQGLGTTVNVWVMAQTLNHTLICIECECILVIRDVVSCNKMLMQQ